MPFSPHDYFRITCNKKRVHIEQLRLIRDKPDTDKATRHRLDRKISHERHQLSVISDIWNVA